MPTDDDLLDAAPCPKCKSPIQVAVADIGFLIECPNCATQFRAKAAEKLGPPPGDRKRGEEPRRRNWDGDREPDEESDDSPRRRPERDDGDEYAHRRRRPRRRDEFDDDEPRREPGRGAAVGAAVMNFIFAAIALLEGLCGGWIGAMSLSEGRGGGDAPFGSNEAAGAVFLGFGLCNLFATGLMIPAGIGLLQRRNYGRTVGFLAGGMGLVNVLLIVVLMIGFFTGLRRTPETVAIVFLIPIVLWLAYSITCLILLGKVRRQPH